MDQIEKRQQQMGFVERVVSSLPGIKGYRAKEMRRGVDKQVRDTFAHELETRRTRISGLQQELLSSGGLLWMDDVERVVGRLQLLIDRARTATYGYAPWFDLEQIKEDELERLVEHDRSMFESLPALDEAIENFGRAVRANENIQGTLQVIAGLLADLNEKFGRRTAAIQGGA